MPEDLALTAAEITDSLPVLIAVFDAGRCYRYCNPAYKDWFGMDPASLIGRRFESVVGDEVYEAARPHIAKVLLGEDVNFEATFAYRHGPARRVNVHYTPQREGDRITGYVSLTIDVSAQRAAEMQLRALKAELEQKITARTRDLNQTVETLQATIQGAPDAVIVLDADGAILDANPPAERLFGIDRLQLLSLPLSSFLPVSDVEEFSEFFEESKRESADIRATSPRQSYLRHRQGRLIPVEVAIGVSPRLDHFPAFIRDISQRRKLESELLQVAVDERQRIAQDLHDSLCQEISAMHFALADLARRLAAVASPEADFTRKIALMAEETLNHARQTAHGLGPLMSEGDDLLRALKRLARINEELCHIQCAVHAFGNFTRVERDVGTQLYHITQEALNNVLRHAKATRIDIEVSVSNEEVILRVTDNGRGVRPNGDPTGRGLRFMRYRASAMNGTLRLRNRPGGGTELECRVPLTHSEPSPSTDTHAPSS